MHARTHHHLRIIAALVLCVIFAYLPIHSSSPASLALDNGLARTPPMGWNSWNRYGCEIDEQMIRRMADAMVASGMRDAGYEYIVVDDCWQGPRDRQGAITADSQTFPNGIAALASYVHERGLKFGLYTDAGKKSCMGRVGSYGHEWQDMFTFAAWGVDYVKIDWCAADGLDAATQFALFRDAIAASGRPMVISICTWGKQNPWDWGADTGHLWRTTGDIDDSWPTVLRLIRENSIRAYAGGPGHWNDPDMLEVGNGRMRDTEYRSHFSLWAMMAAPLIAGNDLSRMNAATRAILLNNEIIAIDQDARGTPALIVRDDGGPQVWSRSLADPNARAVALFNPTDAPAAIAVRWAEIGLPAGPAAARDLWAHADLGMINDGFTITVAPHDTAMVKIVATPSQVLPTAEPNQPVFEPQPAQLPIAMEYPFLSDKTPISASNGHGPFERDSSNGETAAGDGRRLTIGGVGYDKGLGVHAPADLRYDLGGHCSAFAADIGIDSEVGSHGAVAFQVVGDGVLLYDSGTITGGLPPVPVEIAIEGIHELQLLVIPRDTNDYAHADWGAARLACRI